MDKSQHEELIEMPWYQKPSEYGDIIDSDDKDEAGYFSWSDSDDDDDEAASSTLKIYLPRITSCT